MHINDIQFLLNLGKVKKIREPLTVYWTEKPLQKLKELCS